MEQVLDTYERPYDARRPVVCFDERPCQLLGDVLVPIPMKPGRVECQDYHYERHGTCVVLMAVEPLAGYRIVKVTERKTKKDYAEFMQAVAAHYSDVDKIVLVQDNLNTHNPSSFYEVLDAPEAFALAQRFEMVYTPKKASWLNMAEIELSALSKQCLDRRIDKMFVLAKEVMTWSKKRNRLETKITWQFTKSKARDKLNRHYQSIKN
ncbi:MAG: transposase [Omnitrophica WOR_2 bacterium RIFCSPHIGHO2_02_FULL_52_10]|nr:MAG: transposase [Omnitrophica WOR_2 bacterium RIFCSPHIGHO2_02_FULL_52_10]